MIGKWFDVVAFDAYAFDRISATIHEILAENNPSLFGRCVSSLSTAKFNLVVSVETFILSVLELITTENREWNLSVAGIERLQRFYMFLKHHYPTYNSRAYKQPYDITAHICHNCKIRTANCFHQVLIDGVWIPILKTTY